jgi:hypothetical protein
MKRLIIRGDPGVRKNATIAVDGEEYEVFGVARQGEWHGPERVQLWCTVGSEDEQEAYARREFISMFLDTESVDADVVEVIEAA